MVKETYYTSQSIVANAVALRRRVEAQIELRSRLFSPERSALLALDMQRYFFDPASHAYVPSAPAILPGIQALVRAYRKSGLPVVFTRHLNTPDDAGMMASWWRDLIAAEGSLSQILPSLESGGQELVKSQYDAFYRTALEENLRANGVQQVLISGVMTHLCCETTARSAFMRGFEVFVLVDGMATYTEQLHFASLLSLAHGFASPLLCDEAMAAVEKLHEVGDACS